MDIVLRVVAVFVFLAVAFRSLGKREIGTMSAFELVTLMLIPEIVSESLIRQSSLTSALIGAATVLVMMLGLSMLTHRFPRFAVLTEGTPTVLVAHGKLRVDACNRERIQPEDILAEVHKNGLERLEDVRWAILETDGVVTIVPERGPSTGANRDGQRAGLL